MIALVCEKTMNFRPDGRGNWSFDQLESMQHFQGGNFSLGSLYKFYTKRDLVGAHRAQDDCWALISVVLAYGKDFLHYADSQAQQLHFD